MSPLEGRVRHIDYIFIHLSCMYRVERQVPRTSCAARDGRKMMEGKKDYGQRLIIRLRLRASKVKQLDSDLLEQVLSIKWKENVCTVFYGNTACPRLIEAAPLIFSHEQQQQCLQSSTNDNLCSYSVALFIAHRLYIFQWHQITVSLLCMVHQPFLKLPPL